MIEIRGNSKRKLKGYFHSNNVRLSLFYKRILTLSLLFLFFLSSTIINSTQIINEQAEEKLTLIDEHLKLSNQEDDIFKLIYGTMYGPTTLDPQNCWDSASSAVIDQVCEGLFGYNLSDPDLAIIPKLASANGTWNGNNYTVPLRQGVFFHDGTKFNATAVNFTFDRLAYFMVNGLAQASSLYEYYDVDTSSFLPIINHTEIEDEYTIKFVLNKPYGPFEALLCFPGSYILSPASTNATGVIDTLTGDLVGTGPFVYDHYIPNDEVKFHAFENYWAGKPNITILKFSIIQNAQERNDALLSGEVDIITDPMSSMYPTFDTDPDVTLFNAGKSLVVHHLGMNNHWINVSFRKAISYAINYSYIIEELLGGEAVRLKSPIPEGIGYANWSFNVATYNVSQARMIMQSMGFGTTWDPTFPGVNESQWQAASFASFNYTYNIGNTFRENIGLLLQNNLDLIGINVTDAGMTWVDYLYRLYEMPGLHRNMLQLYWNGWIPDYNDPKNFINPLFTNRTIASNTVKYNGGYGPDGPFQPYGPLIYDQNEDVQLLMEQALFETDPAVRESLYDKIQQLIVERDMPWAFGYVGKNYDAYQNHILGFQSNAMGQLNFHKVYQNSSIAPHNIYIEGNQEWIYLKNSSRCTGNGTYSDPYVLKDLVIDGRNKSVSCIRIEDSDVFFRIENCTFFNSTLGGIEFKNVSNSLITYNNCTNNNYGIYINYNNNVNITANLIQSNSIYGITLNNSNNDLIFNNTFQLNSNAAIYSEFSNNNTIYDNFINASVYGIFLMSSNITLLSNNGIQNCSNSGIILIYSTKNTVTENYLYRNYGGIFDQYGFNNSYLKNTVIENSVGGICVGISVNITISMNDVIGSSMGGIILQKLNHSFIINNNISQNGDFGISLAGYSYSESINNTISQNTIRNTNETGLGLTNFTKDNLIFNNEFINNSLNAQDNGTFNLWDNGIIGNIWDDYDGVDANDDGIGDSPYLINGSAGSQDNFLIWRDSDDIAPQITINTPNPNDLMGKKSPTFNITIIDQSLNSTWYRLWNGTILTANTSFEYLFDTEIDQNIWSEVGNGTVTLTFFANDSIGRLTHKNVTVRKDNEAPQITINSPYSNQFFGYISPSYNVSIFGVDKDSTWYTIDNGITNKTFTGFLGTINQTLWDLRPNGTVKIIFYVNDTTGNLGSYEVIINKDIEAPQITINSPTSSDFFAYSAPAFNFNILEANLDTMWYTIDDGFINITFIGFSGSINQSEWDKKGSGTIIIRFYANDTAGNLGFDEVIIIKDVEVPQITIYSPASSENFANFAPAFSLNILEENLDTMWYTIDGGITNIPFIGFSGSIDQSEWDKKGSGTIIIRFYANDTAGNLGFSSVSVQKSLAYWKLNPFIIDDTGLGDYTWAQAALQGWCGGSGTWNNPYIIENVIINGENSGSCIEIRNSNVPFIIRNSIMSYSGSGDFDAGIKLNNVSNCLLYNINGSSNNNFGVILIDCLNNTITESTINDNGVGGILLHYSNNNSIIDNTQTIHNNVKYGILLNSSFYNIIHNNYISYCQYGIYFYNSSENQIIYNIFVGNDVSHEESADSGDNIYEHNDDDTIPSDGDPLFPPDLLIIIAIIAIAAITSITIVVVLKKKISQRTGTKLKRKMDKNEATIRNKLQKKMSFVDDLIKENKIDIALKNLEKVRKKADASDFNAIFNKANERITHCNKLQREPGYKVEPESVVTPVVTSIATTAVAPVIKTKEKGKFTVFLSYSTLDSNYFQIPKIVEDLEKYPDIEKVLIWEKDSSQNIVEFMEDTLSKSDVFVLFCSDNSMKSPAVKDEWQSAFQMRKKDLLKIIPVYDKEDHIPYLLWQLLNIQYTKDDFQGFIEKLHNEILRE